ncbi:MAG: hypothetical protein ACI88G_001991 [Woeseiaceae bacterium]|jgi:hypothetical protein
MSRVVVVSGIEWSLCHAALRPIERPEKGVLLEGVRRQTNGTDVAFI